MWILNPWVETITRVVKTISVILAAIGTAILFFVDIPALAEVPDWLVAIILAVAVIFVLFSDKIANERHRLEVARLRFLLDERRDLRRRIKELAKFRSKAVTEIYSVTPTAEEFKKYQKKYENWQSEVEDYLEQEFPYAVVEMFTDLGMIKTLKFTHASADSEITEKHTKILQMLAKQLTILEKWIEEKSSLTLETEPTRDDLLTRVGLDYLPV